MLSFSPSLPVQVSTSSFISSAPGGTTPRCGPPSPHPVLLFPLAVPIPRRSLLPGGESRAHAALCRLPLVLAATHSPAGWCWPVRLHPAVQAAPAWLLLVLSSRWAQGWASAPDVCAASPLTPPHPTHTSLSCRSSGARPGPTRCVPTASTTTSEWPRCCALRACHATAGSARLRGQTQRHVCGSPCLRLPGGGAASR